MLTKESTLLGHRDEISQHLRNGLLHVFYIYIKQVKLAKMWDDFSDFSEYLEKLSLHRYLYVSSPPTFMIVHNVSDSYGVGSVGVAF